MVDKNYKKALKEVNDILENTEEELINAIPKNVKEFIRNNMDEDYESKIQSNLEIDKQDLLEETEEILSLLYRNYWATEEEKMEISRRDDEEIQLDKKIREEQDIENIFKKRKNNKKNSCENQLIVVKKQNIFTKIINKIIKMFKNFKT